MDEDTDDGRFGGVTYDRATPRREHVWERVSPDGPYGVVSSWQEDRDDRPLDDRDYYGDSFRGRHPPVRRWREAPYRGVGPRGHRERRIVAAVSEELARDGHVDARDVTVAWREGVLTLHGTVGDRAQKRRAEALAERHPGVEDVDNRLTLRPARLP
ncbi:MAG: BON domain-containing protein [Myxococcota bacterium]